MLRVDFEKWNQTPQMLHMFGVQAPHPRTRERFMALYEITQGRSATVVAQMLDREDETVQGWVHLYQERGPDALIYRRTGGRPPFVLSSPPR